MTRLHLYRPHFYRPLKPLLLILISIYALPAEAAGFKGSELSLGWCMPFVMVLLSIALCPLLLPKWWHQHSGKLMLSYSLFFLIMVGWQMNAHQSLQLLTHALIQEYIPFIILLTALYTIAGGIHINRHFSGQAGSNTALLFIGTLLAGFMGTTGAAMLMIRPLLKANSHRRHQQHTIIFFIILVGNIGGGLTPLGDPPLFLGFLQGVGFGWTLHHMLAPVFINTLVLLIMFYLLDRRYLQHKHEIIAPLPSASPWQLRGQFNIVLLLLVIAVILFTAIIPLSAAWQVGATEITLASMIRDGALLCLTLISLLVTPKAVRQDNQFNWQPMQEVAKLFIAIFITIAPVMAILQAGEHGALAAFIRHMHLENGQPNNLLYFWSSGLLSGFLDNAPTYLVFFNLAGGEAQTLMQHMPHTLLAISMGSVFMGALSYIGNAPNLMIKTMAEQQHITMPNFFGYIRQSALILLPLFLLDSLLFLA
ncbi:sodium:proton antiporter [Neisseriaceae bacterium ESL0693]|nr:sodium:proton antiporter [Neisseriaceae bacterium ESL0693]